MSNQFERRPLHDDLIDDIIEHQTVPQSNKSSYFLDSAKTTQNRTHESLPTVFNRPKFDPSEHSFIPVKAERPQIAASTSRIQPSSILMSNDERRKEIDRIIQHLYNGKLLTNNNEEFSGSESSEPPVRILTKEPTATNVIVVPALKFNDEKKLNELPALDADVTSLQRELKEKELDITHLHNEIQELQLENKLLKANGSASVYLNNNNESEVLRREKELLKNRFDEINFQQKEVFEKKLKSVEKHMMMLANENDILKQNSHQSERVILQLRRENEELQQKVTEAKKRNDELFYQEFHSLRNNLKVLKERNNELFQENLRLQQGQTSSITIPHSTIHDQQQIPPNKVPNVDSKPCKSLTDESPYMSEGSESTNYLTTVSVDRYNPRSVASVYHSAKIEGNNQHRTTRYNALNKRDDIINTNITSIPLSKSFDQPLHFRSSKSKRIADWNEQLHSTNDAFYHRDTTIYNDEHPTRDDPEVSAQVFQSCFATHRNLVSKKEPQSFSRSSFNTNVTISDRAPPRVNTIITSPKRPYAPLSISDIHVGDIVKFSRQGGKVSKGAVKYIGSLPGKNDQYLGLELDNEESKHDGVYQDQRIFQCKQNKGVFVGFNKVIMAWSEQ
ncbi:unnamed protein product [Adineta ricciae]|uniref:CAP-Gly domain-containing protein n=1 Tax=Adineta ricciae TaxID=249248 RepID=A0A815WJM8_ADIRI|nr:unnamed protein product [Adineta ricciae]